MLENFKVKISNLDHSKYIIPMLWALGTAPYGFWISKAAAQQAEQPPEELSQRPHIRTKGR